MPTPAGHGGAPYEVREWTVARRHFWVSLYSEREDHAPFRSAVEWPDPNAAGFDLSEYRQRGAVRTQGVTIPLLLRPPERIELPGAVRRDWPVPEVVLHRPQFWPVSRAQAVAAPMRIPRARPVFGKVRLSDRCGVSAQCLAVLTGKQRNFQRSKRARALAVVRNRPPAIRLRHGRLTGLNEMRRQ